MVWPFTTMNLYWVAHAHSCQGPEIEMCEIESVPSSTPAFFINFFCPFSVSLPFPIFPHLSSDCCIGLEQFAGVGPVVSVVASFPQQTENRTFCLVLQSWLTTSHCTDYYYVTPLFRRVLVVLGLNTTLKLIRPSLTHSLTHYASPIRRPHRGVPPWRRGGAAKCFMDPKKIAK